jgi:VWFA-related protein
MRRTLTLLTAATLCAVIGSAPEPRVHAQAPPAGQQRPDGPVATFTSSTRLIVQAVTVTDKDGRPIEGLTAKDFVVTEEGVPQEIAFVEYQEVERDANAPAPAPVPARPAVAASVTTLTEPAIAVPTAGDIKYRDRRLLVLYFDMGGMGQVERYRAMTNSLEFIAKRMDPADVMAIMVYDGTAVRVKQDFTDDKAALTEVINLMIYGKDEDGDGVRDPEVEGSAFGENDAEFSLFNTDRQLAALQRAVTMLRPLPEQKTLIYFSSGVRMTGTDNQAQMRATVNAAVRSNVTLNPIDARGLVALAPMGDASRPSPGGMGVFTGRTADMVMANFQRSQDTLFALAKDTGGKAMFDYNDLSLGIEQAADGMTNYYIVGYYSSNTTKDGKLRRVRVTLANGREGQLAYRPGYYGDKEFSRFTNADKEQQLQDALALGDPITEITIALEVNFFQLNSAEYFVPISVKIPGSELNLARRRGAARTEIDFIGELKDEAGSFTTSNLRDKAEFKLDDKTAEQFSRSPIQYQYGFTVLPGKYVMKFLARDATTGRIGTYQTSFEVPNLVKMNDREQPKLPISSVVLSSQRIPLGDELYSVKQRVPSDAVDPFVQDGQRLVPSVTRVFSRARDMYVYLQAYERGATAMRPVVAFVTFFQNGEKVLETQPLAVTDGMHPRSFAVPIRFSVPMEQLEPGRYDAQVTVLEPETKRLNFWRSQIVVVP